MAKRNTKNTKISTEGWITTHLRLQLVWLFSLEKKKKQVLDNPRL